MSLTTLESLPPELIAKIASYGTPEDMKNVAGLGLVDKGNLSSELEPEAMSYKSLVRLSHIGKVEAHLRAVAAALRARVPGLPSNIPDSALVAAVYYLLRPDGGPGPVLRDIGLINVLMPEPGAFRLISTRTANTVLIRIHGVRTTIDFANEDNLMHRVDGPASRSWNSDGVLVSEWWNINGAKHRIGGPSLRLWDDEGHLFLEEWCEDGLAHRIGGPALTLRGPLVIERWFVRGQESTTPTPTP